VAWKQGEHVAVIGMTGSGKTTLARQLLDLRGPRIMLVTKVDDVSWSGWKTVRKAEAIVPPRESQKGPLAYRLWPQYERSKLEFARALALAWSDGHWCVYLDELYHLEEIGLKTPVIKLLTQGRAKKVSVMLGVQRPAWVTRFALSEPTHIFAFQMGDKRDLKALSDGISDSFAAEVARLERYHFAYYNKMTRETRTGTATNLAEVLA